MLMQRERVTFGSGDVTCAGYLYHPTEAEAPTPGVVLAHGFSGTMDRLMVHASRLASAGLAALIFDYRSFGESDGTPGRRPRGPTRGPAGGGRLPAWSR